MTKEQKELLYEIAKLYSADFYNRMKDNWTTDNYLLDTKYRDEISKLENEYSKKYGTLPEWKYINDVWNAIKQLKEELDE